MTREEFQQRYSEDWERLEKLVRYSAAQRRHTNRYVLSSPPDLAEFDRLYRTVCKHLALARSRLYGTDLIDRLNHLALSAHREFYGGPRDYFQRMIDFIAGGFAATVRGQARLVWISTVLFLVPGLIVSVARTIEPETANIVLGSGMVREMESMYSEGSEYRSVERQGDTDTMMFGFYIFNNISIAFQTFASGILFCAGSIMYLVYNGLAIGAIASHLSFAGHGARFWPFVVGHSSLELTAIIFSGAAGLRLGASVIAPGRRTRVDSLRHAAHDSVGMIAGFFCMLVGAAFVEAYWSSSALPSNLKYIVGLTLWVLMIAYFVFAGRSRSTR